MQPVGVRELKEHTSEILRRVREDGETIDVTYRGRIVARLVPVNVEHSQAAKDALLADLDELAAEIGSRWPPELSAVEAVREVRREL
jgi:prevent-host-death family protein